MESSIYARHGDMYVHVSSGRVYAYEECVTVSYFFAALYRLKIIPLSVCLEMNSGFKALNFD